MKKIALVSLLTALMLTGCTIGDSSSATGGITSLDEIVSENQILIIDAYSGQYTIARLPLNQSQISTEIE